MIWIIDGNNVMGSAADGWWKNRPAAAQRLAQEVAVWSRTHGDVVELIFDGPDQPEVAVIAGGSMRIRFSGSSRRNSADDVIAAVANDWVTATAVGGEATSSLPVVVATSDRGLIGRLPQRCTVEGARTFLRRVRPDR